MKKLTAKEIEQVAFHRAEIERITGRMVRLRDREAYNANMREVMKGARERQKKRMAVLLRKEKELEALKEKEKA